MKDTTHRQNKVQPVMMFSTKNNKGLFLKDYQMNSGWNLIAIIFMMTNILYGLKRFSLNLGSQG